MRRLGTLLSLILFLLTTAAIADEMPILEVSVLEDGQILIGGEQADIDSLEAALRALSEEDGMVLYYRENAASPEPHPAAFEVLDLVVQYERPIALSTTADFSTIVQADGTVIPREDLFAPAEPYGWPTSEWTYSREEGRCMLRQFFGYGTDSARANTRLVFIAEDSGGTGTESDDEETGERAPILLISPNYVGFDIVRVVVGGYVVPIAGRPSMDDGSELLNAVLEPPGSESVFEAIAQDGDLVFEYVSSNGDAFRFLYARYEDDQFDGAREQFERCVDGR